MRGQFYEEHLDQREMKKTTKKYEQTELNVFLNGTIILATLKNQRLKWAGHVWRAEDQLIRTVTKWKPNKSRPIQR